MRDKNNGKSRGFGYITMKDSLIIEKILRSYPLFIEGKQVECKIAIPKDHLKEDTNIPINSQSYSSENTYTSDTSISKNQIYIILY